MDKWPAFINGGPGPPSENVASLLYGVYASLGKTKSRIPDYWIRA
jgi:hypothetical protein